MMPILCLVADSRYRATGYGVLNLCSCLTGGIAVYAGGKLLDHGMSLNGLFQVASGVLLMCAILLFAVKPAAHQGGSPRLGVVCKAGKTS